MKYKLKYLACYRKVLTSGNYSKNVSLVTYPCFIFINMSNTIALFKLLTYSTLMFDVDLIHILDHIHQLKLLKFMLQMLKYLDVYSKIVNLYVVDNNNRLLSLNCCLFLYQLFAIKVTWSDKKCFEIYRRYGEFFTLQVYR